MATTFSTDIDSIANTYLRSRVNAINPYHLWWHPEGVNFARLDWFSTNPPEASPSTQLAGTEINGAGVSNAVRQLARYYSRVVTARYGVNGNHTGAFSAVGYFVLDYKDPSFTSYKEDTYNAVVNRTPAPTGNVTKQHVIDLYNEAWEVINSRRHSPQFDVTVCHSSYVAPPHSARGRR